MLNNIVLGIFGLGGTEMIIVLVIVLLLFGGKKIPELMKGLGRGVKEFKDASKMLLKAKVITRLQKRKTNTFIFFQEQFPPLPHRRGFCIL
jgi:sec-independent protein translocase protein TatA